MEGETSAAVRLRVEEDGEAGVDAAIEARSAPEVADGMLTISARQASSTSRSIERLGCRWFFPAPEWEVVPSIKIEELTAFHTELPGSPALYTTAFLLVMNKARYEATKAKGR